jgi:hypothetical protein
MILGVLGVDGYRKVPRIRPNLADSDDINMK